MSDRREFRDLAEPAAVHDQIDRLDVETGTERVPLGAARGRVLAERVDAGLDVPGFDRASMDGYAVRAADTFDADEREPAVLDLAGTVHAGERPGVTVEPGTAVETSTGAVLPPGADAVVVVERTADHDDGVEVRTAVAPGDNVMPAGDDIAAGERALGPGRELSSREIGLLSALGVDSVPVVERPTVGIISTGDELVRPGGVVDSAAGQIYDVNSYTLASSVEAAGGDPTLYPHVGDDYEEMRSQLGQVAAECDLILSSGSTSASAVDVIYDVIETRGTLHLHGVAIKPGKPMLVGEFDDAAYVGLPGYPVSALATFRTFVAPKIRRLAGLDEPRTATVTGRMAADERYEGGRRRLVPVGLVENGDGETLVYPVDKGSGATTSLVRADGFVTMAATTNRIDAGQEVTVALFSPEGRPPTLLGAGEDDPVLSALLDRLDRPRFLPTGSREALRRLADGISDIAVAAGPVDAGDEAALLASWNRTWGLVVDEDADIEGLTDLVDGEYRFVNLGRDLGLRESLDDALATLADERGVNREELTDRIDGYGVIAAAYESPAHRVVSGQADAGLGLEATAADLDARLVPVGTQPVRVFLNPDREGKPGVEALQTALEDLSGLVDSVVGASQTD